MTDRELLERAAMAAGITGSYFHSDNPIHCGIYQARGEYYWNPLISDSEALRLAVKLRQEIHIEATFVRVWTQEGWCIDEDVGANDLAATTRRAIVRAAALGGAA